MELLNNNINDGQVCQLYNNNIDNVLQILKDKLIQRRIEKRNNLMRLWPGERHLQTKDFHIPPNLTSPHLTATHAISSNFISIPSAIIQPTVFIPAIISYKCEEKPIEDFTLRKDEEVTVTSLIIDDTHFLEDLETLNKKECTKIKKQITNVPSEDMCNNYKQEVEFDVRKNVEDNRELIDINSEQVVNKKIRLKTKSKTKIINNSVKWIGINKDEGDSDLKTDGRVVNDVIKTTSGENYLKKEISEKLTKEDFKETGKEEKKETVKVEMESDYTFSEVLKPVAVLKTNTFYVTREKSCIETKLQNTYFMHSLEENGARKVLLASRKRLKSTNANYLLSTDPEDLTHRSKSCVGKLKSNGSSTKFSAFQCDDGDSGVELVSVVFKSRFSNTEGGCKMNVILPCMNENLERLEVSQGPKMLHSFRDKDLNGLVVLKSMNTNLNDVMKYKTNLQTRYILASRKNFQLVHSQDPSYLVMQFAKLSNDCFWLEYHYPLCSFQAFAIVLSVFENNS